MTTAARLRRFAPVIAALVGFAFYAYHLSPTTNWGDSAGLHLRVDEPLDLGARDYPLFRLMLRAVRSFPTADFYYNANLLTAALGAAALGVMFLLVRDVTGRTDAAAAATAVLGVSHTFWTYAVITEVYTLNLLLLATFLLFLVRFGRGSARALVPLMLAAGIALGHHRLLAFVTPAALVHFIRHRDRFDRRHVALAAGALLVGAALPIALFIRDVRAGRAATDVLVYFVRGEVGKSLFNADPHAFARSAVDWLGYLGLNFFGLALPLAAVGAVRLVRRHRDEAWLFALTLIAFAGFAIGYRHHGIWIAYNTHGFLVVAVLAGIGFAALRDRWPRPAVGWTVGLALALVPALLFPRLPAVLDALGTSPYPGVPAERRALAHEWLLNPSRRRDTSPADIGRAILARLDDDDVLLADWGVIALIRLLQRDEGLVPALQTVDHGGNVHDERIAAHRATGGDVWFAHLPYYGPRLNSRAFTLRPAADRIPLLLVIPADIE